MSADTERDFDFQRRAQALVEALPYIQEFHKQVVVIKYGGHVMVDADLSMSFARDVVLLRLVGMQPVIVHGGGPQITEMMTRLGMKSKFHEGLRITDLSTLEVVRMVLVGKIGRDIVRAVKASGGAAVGISGEDGNLISAVPRHPELGYVGDVASVNPHIIRELLDSDVIPVVSPVGADSQGQAYNINADVVAASLGVALGAAKLIYLTDVNGLLADADDPSSVLSTVTVDEVYSMIDRGVITDGMIPKTRACVDALRKGVLSAHLLNGCIPNVVLLEIFTDSGIGTMINRGNS